MFSSSTPDLKTIEIEYKNKIETMRKELEILQNKTKLETELNITNDSNNKSNYNEINKKIDGISDVVANVLVNFALEL